MVAPGPTLQLARFIANRRWDELDARTREVSRQCLLDCLGVALAARDEPLVRVLLEEQAEEGGNPQATLWLAGRKASLSQAALINGAMAHAHDYDDVHTVMSGHPSVPVVPAVLALAEWLGSSGKAVLTALATGIDAECLVGRYLGPSHYARGFHATATVGSLGAAAACSNLLGLTAEQTCHALGIAATQAAGLKSMFGTMCKPLHAGRAAANGVQAACLARKGFESCVTVLEAPQGFAATLSDTASVEAFQRALEQLPFVPDTLFKYHAACYMTHSTLEAARALRERHRLSGEEVESVRIEVDRGHFGVCNIQQPRSGLEAKFSLRFACAMALTGVDTSRIQTFTDELTQRPDLVALRDRTEVVAQKTPSPDSTVELRLRDGRRIVQAWNVAVPERDLQLQRRRLRDKFLALTGPLLTGPVAEGLADRIGRLDEFDDLTALLQAIAVFR